MEHFSRASGTQKRRPLKKSLKLSKNRQQFLSRIVNFIVNVHCSLIAIDRFVGSAILLHLRPKFSVNGTIYNNMYWDESIRQPIKVSKDSKMIWILSLTQVDP